MALCLATAIGCGTTRTSNTARTATEQLLISDAIDRTVQQINFEALRGEAVFFEVKNLKGVVDEGYLGSSLRQHLLASGCVLKEKREDATFILEPRVGAVGTDNHDLMFGIPALNVPQVATAGMLPSAIPEIAFAKRRDQAGIAKIAVFAYRRETGEPVWQSGIAMNKSTANDIWLFGAGPFKRGTIYDEQQFCGPLNKFKKPADEARQSQVAGLSEEASFVGAPYSAGSSRTDAGVVQASAHMQPKRDDAVDAPVLPPARPISEAPKPPKEDPAATAG